MKHDDDPLVSKKTKRKRNSSTNGDISINESTDGQKISRNLKREIESLEPEKASILGTKNPLVGMDLTLKFSSSLDSAIPGHSEQELACAFLTEMKPRGAVETMLCNQLISLHSLGMEFIKRTKNSEIRQNIDANMNCAVKLLRLQHETIETLNRHRRGGEQRVIVQHVQVNDGGKAIVNGQMTSEGDVK